MSLQRSPPNRFFSSQPNLDMSEEDIDDQMRINTRKRKFPEGEHFNEFREEMKGMLKEFQTRQEGKLDSVAKAIEALIEQNTKLIQSNNDIEIMLQESKVQQDKLTNKVNMLETECSNARNKINLLEDQLNDLHKNQIKKLIEIRNVPKLENENLHEIVTKMMKALNVSNSNVTIKEVYRRGINNAPITVEMAEFDQKIQILKAVKLFNTQNKDNKLSTNHLGLNSLTMPIYVSEKLTPRTKLLLSSAKKLVKDGLFKFCWISKGVVLLRKTEGDPPVVITTEEDLKIAVSSNKQE